MRVCIDFIGLTLGASLDVVLDVLFQFRPPVGPCNQVFCSHYPWMSGSWRVVEFLHNLPSFHCVACYYQPSFFIPFSSKLFKPMRVCPFSYRRHLLTIEWLHDSQTANEQGVREYHDVLIIPCPLIIIWASG